MFESFSKSRNIKFTRDSAYCIPTFQNMHLTPKLFFEFELHYRFWVIAKNNDFGNPRHRQIEKLISDSSFEPLFESIERISETLAYDIMHMKVGFCLRTSLLRFRYVKKMYEKKLHDLRPKLLTPNAHLYQEDFDNTVKHMAILEMTRDFVFLIAMDPTGYDKSKLVALMMGGHKRLGVRCILNSEILMLISDFL